jgi:hypothetical protein
VRDPHVLVSFVRLVQHPDYIPAFRRRYVRHAQHG